MRNPKKASIRYEVESRACYLTNQRSEKKRNDNRGTTGKHCEAMVPVKQCGVDWRCNAMNRPWRGDVGTGTHW